VLIVCRHCAIVCGEPMLGYPNDDQDVRNAKRSSSTVRVYSPIGRSQILMQTSRVKKTTSNFGLGHRSLRFVVFLMLACVALPLVLSAAGNLSGYSNVATATTQATVAGLVAAYSFNEGTGATVADSSGLGNTGTVANTTWTTSGKFGNALVFNGSSSFVTINDSGSLHLTTGMTLEAWVNPTTVSSAWRDVIYKGNDSYYLEGTSDNSSRPAGGGTWGASPVYGTAALTANTWAYLALTYDGANLRLYVNGAQVASQARTGNIASSTNPLQIGGDSIYGQYFQGTIDEVRVYNVALTATQIQSDMVTAIGTGGGDTQPPTAPSNLAAAATSGSQINLSWTASTDNVGVTQYLVERCQGAGCTSFAQVGTSTGTTFNNTGLTSATSYSYRVRARDAAGNLSGYSNIASATTQATVAGLVAAYSFNEGTGTTVGDSSGLGNTGTVANTTWTTSGKFGNALVFNGSSSFVTINDSGSLHLTTGMTLEAWVNPTTVSSAWRDVIYKGNDSYYLEGTSDNSSRPAGGGTWGASPVYGTAALTANTWAYLALTYDGANLRLYVNGAQVASQARTGNIASSTNPLQIGGDSIYGQYFQGTIDEVRVYNVALTATQIQSDMVTAIGTGGGDTQPPTAPSNLAAAATSGSQINLSWTASTDNVGVTQYLVERCQGAGCTSFAQVGTSTGTTFNNTGLTSATSYSYRVRARDAAGNLSGYSNIASATTQATIPLAITPRVAALTITQNQQFTSSIGSVTWSADGVQGGSVSSGTITSSGLYTPPTTPGTHIVTATTTDLSQSSSATVYITNYPGTFTHHNDNLRTGWNSSETVLTPGNVNQAQFGKLFSYAMDGIAFASPLYVANVSMPGHGFHNVVYVATEHNSVYAWDADRFSSSPLWQVSFLSSSITPVPCGDTGECGDIPNEIGITGTPVIDHASGTLYVVAKTKEGVNYVQRLHALDITTGAEKFGGPVSIQVSVPGSGEGSQGGQLPFDPLRENQRPALALNNGVVYIGWAAHGDQHPWHGWVIGYNASTLKQVAVYCVSPDGYGGGVWASGGGLGVDASGNIYFNTGNGDFTASTGGRDYGDSVVKLGSSGSVLDYFTPHDEATLESQDLDLASAGPVLLVDQPGPNPHLLITAAKGGTIYVVNRDNMGHFKSGNDNQIVQSLVGILPNGTLEEGNFSAPAYFNGYVYFAAVNDTLKAFRLSNGLLSNGPTSHSLDIYPNRGGSFAVSGNGNNNGIIWALQDNNPGNGVLHAYDAGNLSNEFYNSRQAGSRDTLGVATKFSIPLVANGKVFVGSQSQLVVYGLLP
jgi:chitodextrinase